MAVRRVMLTLLLSLPLALLLGCSEYGKVDKGRSVKFDKDKRIVTIIRDKANDTQNPDYSYLPPISYVLPNEPAECGPLPKAGGRMKLDTKKNQIIIFDPAAQNFKVIDYNPVSLMEALDSENPLVKGKPSVNVDRAKKQISIYSGRQRMLVVFSLPEEYFAENYPDSTWDSGDEAMIYYKEDGKALRFMNITQTNMKK